jgi:hypothetical protein
MTERDCHCPYCDGSLTEATCTPCEARVVRCPACGVPQPKDATVCAGCGEKLPETATDKES